MSEAERAPLLVLFGGPAGAGKSTLAGTWCSTRARAAHIQLDAVRALIVAGQADPQQPGDLQTAQYALSVRACCALARVFLADGYDLAIDDVLEPGPFATFWQPALAGLQPRLVIVVPSLEETLRRSRARAKRVQERHTVAQHATCLDWPAPPRIDTTACDLAASLALVEVAIALQ